MNEHKIPVIIDCDPGIDDSFAIYFALNSSMLDVVSIVSVAGNVPLSMTTSNACNLLGLVNSNVPVFAGSDGPLIGDAIEAKYAHGVNGLGGYVFKKEYTSNLQQGNGIEQMARILKSSEQPITIFAIGPLTNIAKLVLAYPDLVGKIDQVVVMGGGVIKGNYSSSAEFNIVADPLAAKVVFDAGLTCKIVPLDTTEYCYFDKEFLQALNQSSSLKAKTLYDIVNAKHNIESKEEDSKFYFHDMVTVMAVTNPQLFEFMPLHVDVELDGKITKGQTVFDQRSFNRNEPNSLLVTTKLREEIVAVALEVLTNE